MATTYLQLVNNVLVGLRETEVADVTGTYAKLIGQLVNQAKREVEARWQWKALRSEVAVVTSASTRSYALSGTTDRSVLMYHQGRPQAFRTDSGNKGPLDEVSREYMRTYINSTNTPQSQVPTSFCIDRAASGLTVIFDPIPDTVYNFSFTIYTPQDELTDKATTISVPAEPVWKTALVYAKMERGSEFQGALSHDVEVARNSLDDAIWVEQGQVEPLTFVEA